MPRLLNAALFYGGWFACVLGAAWGQSAAGTTIAAAILAINLARSSRRAHEAALVVAAGSLGFLVDSAQGLAGVFAFSTDGASAWLCPPWLVAIWMLFATTLNGSMSWLRRRYLVAAVLGAVGGPLSYLYGARLGAIIVISPNAAVILAVVWALAMPALLLLNEIIRDSAPNEPILLRNN